MHGGFFKNIFHCYRLWSTHYTIPNFKMLTVSFFKDRLHNTEVTRYTRNTDTMKSDEKHFCFKATCIGFLKIKK